MKTFVFRAVVETGAMLPLPRDGSMFEVRESPEVIVELVLGPAVETGAKPAEE